MNKTTFIILFLTNMVVFQCKPNPREMVAQAVQKVGGIEKLKKKVDVSYTYTYRDAKSGKENVSIEQYIFKGELSRAKYLKREYNPIVDNQLELIQGFNGHKAWATLNDVPVDDKKILRKADFSRKTNYYWFTMIFKLLDPGLNYEYLGEYEKADKKYDKVKVTFNQNVGDAQDIYILFINRETKLVDQFLFTIMDFAKKEPRLMQVKYTEVAGLWLPTYRRYTLSNWKAEVLSDEWKEEISSDIKFNTKLSKELFNLKI